MHVVSDCRIVFLEPGARTQVFVLLEWLSSFQFPHHHFEATLFDVPFVYPDLAARLAVHSARVPSSYCVAGRYGTVGAAGIAFFYSVVCSRTRAAPNSYS